MGVLPPDAAFGGEETAKKPWPRPEAQTSWTPVFGSVSLPMPAGVSSFYGALSLSPGNLPAVPADKRLVIEFLTISVEVPAGQKVLVAVGTTVGNASLLHRIVTQLLPDVGAADVHMASQTVKLYADPGTKVSFNIMRVDAVGSGHAVVTISGYFTDATA